MNDNIHDAAQLIRSANYAIGLTGAGISTPSGIPDFRSGDTGLWGKFNPMEVASISGFKRKPEYFYEWFQPLGNRIHSAVPNAAHEAFATLEKLGILRATITQNIDGLHQAAGSKNVIEVHGTLSHFVCLTCDTRQTLEKEQLDDYLDSGVPPQCKTCANILKPDAVLYGELLPEDAWLRAEYECRQADLVLIAGTSLEVYPVNSLPVLARRNGAKMIIVNQTRTDFDNFSNVVFREDVAEILPAITKEVLNS